MLPYTKKNKHVPVGSIELNLLNNRKELAVYKIPTEGYE